MASRPKHMAWFLQAESDLRSVKALIATSHYSHACFNAQQASEKAMKSVAFYRGADMVKSHSLAQIIKDLNINGTLAAHASKLDVYYLTSRYPDALPDHSLPSESFSKEMAEEALQMAEDFVRHAKRELQV